MRITDNSLLIFFQTNQYKHTSDYFNSTEIMKNKIIQPADTSSFEPFVTIGVLKYLPLYFPSEPQCQTL